MKTDKKLPIIIQMLILTVITCAVELLSEFLLTRIILSSSSQISWAVYVSNFVLDVAALFAAGVVVFKLLNKSAVNTGILLLTAFLINLFFNLSVSFINVFIAHFGTTGVLHAVSNILSVVFIIIKSVIFTAVTAAVEAPIKPAFAGDRNITMGLAGHILLLIFTWGIWRYIWIYRVTAYLNCLHDEEKRRPGTKLLLNMFVPFYSIYWTYKSAMRVDKLAKSFNIPSEIATPCVILEIFVPLIPPILMQERINRIVETANRQV